MSYVAADWSIDRATGNIRYIGGDHGAAPTYATVIEFHRELQDYADDAVSSGDDEMDITDDTPSARSTDNIITLINGYNIDDTAAEHLYDGSVTQAGGDTIYAGFVNFGNASQIQIIQNGAVLADDWWNSNGGLNSTSGISHRFMLKTRDAGTDIDNKQITATSRVFGQTYSEFSVTSAGEGNNVLALSESADLNNTTIEGTVSGWTSITNTEGYRALDVDNDTTDEYYYSEWNKDTYTINQFYERMKWLQRDGSASTLYGLNGELFRGITHEITVDGPSGTFSAVEAVSWTGGTGQMLAINSTTAPTKMWIQLLTGVAPTDGQTITGGTSSATADVNVTITSRSLSFPFIGASTGSALIGAYGVGLEPTDLAATDKVFDLDNTQVTPPNYVTFTVGGLVSSEDYVVVYPEDGGAIDTDQLSLNTALTTDNITSVVVTASIPSDTPSVGYIRVVDDAGRARRLSYSSWTGSTFTIDESGSGEEDFSGDEAASSNDVYIAYIDKLAASATESFTSVYNADRDLFIRVRDGGGSPIKTFETTGTLGSGGGSTTAIRTSDA